jgi:hypothetical protein
LTPAAPPCLAAGACRAAEELAAAPRGHRFAVLVIRLTIFWFVHLHVSCRAVCSVWNSLSAPLPSPGPGHQTVCTWAMRLGLFLLRRDLPRHPDWVFLIDSTLRLGNKKCLVILGARLSVMAGLDGAPATGDFTVLDVAVTVSCDADFVVGRLGQVCQRVGCPRQIVSDHSGEFTKGLPRFQKQHPDVVATYDVTHKMAILLETELEADERWLLFLKGCSGCLPRMQQTAGAFLMPPSLRKMARYMHVADHVEWARKVLGVLDRRDVAVLAKDLGVSSTEALAWLEQRLGWVKGFREDLRVWAALLELNKGVQAEVKNKGLSRQTPEQIQERFGQQVKQGQQAERWQRWWGRVVGYLKREADQVPEGQRWLASSDTIESLFGRFKNGTKGAPFPEMGANVLLLPVLLTSELPGELIRTAMEQVSGEEVERWVRQNVGDSTLAKIQRVL